MEQYLETTGGFEAAPLGGSPDGLGDEAGARSLLVREAQREARVRDRLVTAVTVLFWALLLAVLSGAVALIASGETGRGALLSGGVAGLGLLAFAASGLRRERVLREVILTLLPGLEAPAARRLAQAVYFGFMRRHVADAPDRVPPLSPGSPQPPVPGPSRPPRP